MARAGGGGQYGRLSHGERPAADQAGQRAALDELHREEWSALSSPKA